VVKRAFAVSLSAGDLGNETRGNVVSGIELAVAALVIREEDVLLIKRGNAPSKGKWTLPGGRVLPGEPLAKAVARELHEETDLLSASVGKLLDVTEWIGTEHHFVICDFRVFVFPDQSLRAGDDADDARWVSRADLSQYLLTSGLTAWLAAHWEDGLEGEVPGRFA